MNRLSPLSAMQTQNRFRPLPWQLRVVTWTVVASQIYTPYAGYVSAQEVQTAAPPTGAVASAYPSPVLTPTNVTVNRTVPQVEPPARELKFSANPTDQEIFQARVFPEPVVSMSGNPEPGENGDLAQALLAFRNRPTPEDASAIENFLVRYPASPRQASLRLNLASIYRKTGQFTKALAAWEDAWNRSRNETEPRAKAVAEQALAELAAFTVTLGRTEPLRALIQQTDGRNIGGSSGEKISQTKGALWDMENNPSQAFKCGPFSLYRIRHHLKLPNPVHQLILDEPSSTNGTSLAQMWELSRKMGMDLQMAKRQPGAVILYPSMVYWKLGHFSALVREENGRYLAEDTTFAEKIWMTPETLDAEAMGYFLVPAGQLPRGWSAVPLEEAKGIWGRMTPTTRDGNALTENDKKTPDPDCGGKGMPQYGVHSMHVSLNIVDTPLGYTPPRGPAVNFKVTYNQREANQPAIFSYSNLGQKWTFDWLSYIQDDPTVLVSDAQMFARGGGAEYFYLTIPQVIAGSWDYDLQPQSHTRLTGYPGKYERTHFDGTREIYDLSNGATNYPRKFFLTAVIDSYGNRITNTFDSNYRVVSITDALGQVTTLEYGSTNATNDLFYKITKVTDPFGRYCTFQYSTNGQMTNITDVIGMSSSFTYTNGDFIDSMTTPYGTTRFSKYEYGLDRWLEITEPDGEKQKVEYKHFTPSLAAKEPDHLVPSGLLTNNLNVYLNMRNTFYWDKKAMREAPGDYTKARLTHWLYTHNSFYIISGVPESVKNPLENRVWYNYPGQVDARMAGTDVRPARIARTLDDGTTQTRLFEYNAYGKTTKVVDPLGRTTTLNYVNSIDLSQVKQGTGLLTDPIIAEFSYNLKHSPLAAVDAARQTNWFGYNSSGQLEAVTNALNEVTTLRYHNSGYLTNISGAITGAVAIFTYDSYGRVRTVTESEGYTVTYDYDALDRLTKVTYPDGSFDQTVYDKLDPILQKDRRGHWSRTIYNAVRQPTAIEDARGQVTQFDWCGCGGLSGIIDPLGRVTTWVRDIQGRVTSKVYSDSAQITYTYEKTTSRIRSVTDAKNQTMFYDYYGDDNLKQVTYSNAVVATPGVSFTYDTNFDRVATIVDGIGTNVYAYYPITNVAGAGRLQTIDGPLANDTTIYEYDELSRVKSWAIDGVAQLVTYDALGRVTIVTNVLGSFTNNYVNATHRLSSVLYPNGQSTVFNYLNNTNDQRLEEIKHLVGTNVLSKFNYTFDADGQIQTWSQQADSGTPKTWVLNYDPVDQLLGATVRSNGITGAVFKRYLYGYDAAGNRTSEQIDLGVTKATYNALNQQTNTVGGGPVRFAGRLDEKGTVQLDGKAATMGVQNTNFVGYADTTMGTNTVTLKASDYSNNTRTNQYQLVVTNNGVAKTLSYDLNGNLTNMVTATTTNSYEWDAANRLTKITQRSPQNAAQLVSEFAYDGSGRRVRIVEKTNGVAQSDKRFLWCNTSLCEERDSTGTNVTKRFFGEGQQISGANYFFTSDHLHSIREVTEISGTVRARYEYDPYGRRSIVVGELDAAFGFTGHYYHQISGLHLALFRQYDADGARWLSRDPIEESGGLNLYSYVRNSPVGRTDPLGLCEDDCPSIDCWPSSPLNQANRTSPGRLGGCIANYTGCTTECGKRFFVGKCGKYYNACMALCEQRRVLCETGAGSTGRDLPPNAPKIDTSTGKNWWQKFKDWFWGN